MKERARKPHPQWRCEGWQHDSRQLLKFTIPKVNKKLNKLFEGIDVLAYFVLKQ